MCFDVVEPILKATGVDFNEKTGIRSIITNSDDIFDARTISDNAVTDAVGAHYRSEEKIAMNGINALGYGMACILSGHDDIVLIVGHCKESQAESRNMVTNLAFDPFFLRPVGLDFENAAALQARAYMEKSGVTDKHLANVVVNSRKKAAKNPVAILKDQITEDQVCNSPFLCDPIRELHAYPISDGAVALLLAADSRVKEFTDKPVWLTGYSNCMDNYFPGERDLTANFSLKKACAKAFSMAGVSKPAEFDVVEVSDAYAYQLPLWMEGIGIAEEGKGGAWIDSGALDSNKINSSGGMLSGIPYMISGLATTAEAVLQLRNEAGDRQVKGAKKALAHGLTGPAGQHQGVLVLEV